MKTVYEALREVLRIKELEIKRLEKEIEALRVVLPIVADIKQPLDEEAFRNPSNGQPVLDPSKPFNPADLNTVFAQASGGSNPGSQIAPEKKRSSWP
ncbi:MAG TPA: hypothetical protein VEG30_03705 [Terriglobales bacterium]|nr:hypothetical protein [Terriglobales bacterium]